MSFNKTFTLASVSSKAVEGVSGTVQVGVVYTSSFGPLGSVQFADGTTFSSLVFGAQQADGSQTVSVVHRFVEEGPVGFSWRVSQGGVTSLSITGTGTTNVSDAPLSMVGSGPFTVNEGSGTGLQTLATFVDSDPDGTVSDYAATIDWGDGTSSVGAIGGIPGALTVSGSHTYANNKAANAPYVVTVTVNDVGGATAAASVQVTVLDVAPTVKFATMPISIVEGTSSSTVYTFVYSISDPGSYDSETPTTSCGSSGTKVAGSDVFTNTGGSFKCTFSSAFLADGPATTQVSVRATDSDGLSGPVASQAVTVANANPVVVTAVVLSSSLRTGRPVSVLAAFTDSGIRDTHTCAIDWRDGTVTVGTVAETGGSGTCLGTHTYSTPGTYAIVVKITDKDGGVGITTVSVSVTGLRTLVAVSPDTFGVRVTRPYGPKPKRHPLRRRRHRLYH
jgi:hypothetical protein